ncbi:MAG TPA: NADH-quinone oxidoreductase subunit NuoE [Caulobacteraceae bacterium]|nr:NADH-quinone oxidoreductase subunit NuoE [Caulobacteraceae bacterium]
MSVRRLAKEQPAGFAFAEEMQKKADAWIGRFPEGRQQAAVVPLLFLAQQQEGWVSEPAIRVIADMLGMAAIRVLEAASFYTIFHLEPMGKVVVSVCGTPPCSLRGSGELMALCEKRIGPRDAPSADSRFGWVEVECMGACANAPMVSINEQYYEDLDPEALGRILDAWAAGKPPPPGSAIGRQGCAPEGGPLTLTDPSLYDGSRAKPIKSLPNAPKAPARA